MGLHPKTVQIPHCDSCNGYLKPDIVLFGEELPSKYSECVKSDLKQSHACKLFIIMGTSLSVYPVAFLPSYVPEGSTRTLLNRERCGPFETVSKQNSYKREIEGKYKHLDLFLGELLVNGWSVGREIFAVKHSNICLVQIFAIFQSIFTSISKIIVGHFQLVEIL